LEIVWRLARWLSFNYTSSDEESAAYVCTDFSGHPVAHGGRLLV
jgi:hypothetical protein